MAARGDQLLGCAAIAVALLSSCLAATPEETKGGGPRLTIAATEISFGRVRQGSPITRSFEVRNTGDADLVISDVRGSCGCTAVSVSPRRVPPGKTAVLTTTLDTNGLAGDTRKRIAISSNDPAKPVWDLALVGKVDAEAAVHPSTLSFGQLACNEKASLDLEVKPARNGTSPVREVRATDPRFAVEERNETAGGGRLYEVKYLGSPDTGRIAAFVEIAFQSPDAPPIRVPVRVSIVGDLRYARNLYFGRRNGSFASREVVMTTRSGNEVKIEALRDPDGLLDLHATESIGQRIAFNARVAHPEARYEVPKWHTLDVETTDHNEPVVRIHYIVSDERAAGSGLLLNPALLDEAAVLGEPKSATLDGSGKRGDQGESAP